MNTIAYLALRIVEAIEANDETPLGKDNPLHLVAPPVDEDETKRLIKALNQAQLVVHDYIQHR